MIMTRMSDLSIAYLAPPDPATSASRLERLLLELSQASDRGDIAQAMRLADAARRVAPDDPAIAVIHGRLLLKAGHYAEALALLATAEEPSAIVVRAECLCRLGQSAEAQIHCRGLLTRHAVDCVEGLDATLDLICATESDHFAGWVAIDSNGCLVGKVPSGSRLHWRPASATVDRPIVVDEGNGTCAFSQALAPADTAPLTVICSAGALLGAPPAWPTDFGYAGWVVLEDGELRGELRNTWAPGRAATLIVGSPGHAERRCTLPPGGAGSTSVVDTSFSIPLSRATGSGVSVSLRLPNGVPLALMGSPAGGVDPAAVRAVVARPERRQATSSLPYVLGAGRLGAPAQDRTETGVDADGITPPPGPVDIIVPVFAGYEETLRCIESVLETLPAEQAELVVVNDASPDPQLCAELERLARERRITLLVNAVNQGFPAAVNRGMQLHPDRDVVLLNADCEVYTDWLVRLRVAAYSAADIASVTPLGEQASIASYRAPACEPRGADTGPGIDAIARRANAGHVVDVPVGVGFCLYLRRDCLAEIGGFNQTLYGRGYGEENDYCLRARQHGWRHVVAANVFVRHSGGRSFGDARKHLMARHGRILNAHHPGYDALVTEHLATDPLHTARRAIDLQSLRERSRNGVLQISHSLGGGVQRFIDARATTLADGGYPVLVLRPQGRDGRSVRLELRGAAFENLRFDMPEDAAALRGALRELGLSAIEVHHFLHLPAAVLDLVLDLGVGYEVYLHDYAWICPRLTLLGGDGRYCGEPAVEECETCVRTHGSAIQPAPGVAALRARSARLLAGARHVYSATHDVQARFARYFPATPTSIVAWEAPRSAAQRALPPIQDRVRVAIIGAISVQKGHRILLACARAAARLNQALEFVLIGFSCDDAALLDTGRVFITGPYAEDEVAGLLARERCHAAFFASSTPETWCFTLTHALVDGLPIVAFDIGAIAERLRGSAHARLLPLEIPPEAINELLLQTAAAPHAVPEAVRLARNSPAPVTMRGEPSVQPAEPTPHLPGAQDRTASVQMLMLPPGVYAFSLGSSGPAGEHREQITLPAIHVGIAPIRSQAQVEFYAGPHTLDRWLAFAGDRVIARVTGDTAGLLLTSLRRPEDAALAIDVRRIDAPMAQDPQALPASGVPQPQVMAHVRQLGDLYLSAEAVGPFGQELWIEAFVVNNPDGQGAERLEYRGITADGYETPWLTDTVLCGSRGRGTPLLGFALRPRVAFAQALECRYVGVFGSGRRVGPLSDGSLCRSDLPNDPLEGIELQVVARE